MGIRMCLGASWQYYMGIRMRFGCLMAALHGDLHVRGMRNCSITWRCACFGDAPNMGWLTRALFLP